MSDFGFEFDPNAVPEPEMLPVIPANTRALMQITEAPVVHKSDDGEVVDDVRYASRSRLNYTVEVLDGPYQGRKVWGGVNFRHPTPLAQTMGQQDLAAMFRVTETPPAGDSDVLLYKPFLGVLKITKDKNGEYDDKNEVNWRKSQSASAGVPATSQRGAANSATSAAATSAKGARPWETAKSA